MLDWWRITAGLGSPARLDWWRITSGLGSPANAGMMEDNLLLRESSYCWTGGG